MRLFANMCVRNEAHRYLDCCLSLIKNHVDAIFVYDDQSTDETVEVAERYASVVVRPDGVPSFIASEGSFRQAGWQSMIEVLHPSPGDWILCVDADELIPFPGQIRETIQRARTCRAVNVPIVEMFSVDPFAERIDGFWGDINGTRLAEYREGLQTFRFPGMGSGVFPQYAYTGGVLSHKNCPLRIYHFGYANEADRIEKYVRYTSKEQNGHASSHVQSIVRTPVLREVGSFHWWRGHV